MWYLTTITFRNDSYSDIKNNPEDVVDWIIEAMDGRTEYSDTFPLWSSSNPVIVQKPVHASENIIYMCTWNSVLPLSTYSDKTRDLINKHPDYAAKLIEEWLYQLRELKKMLKSK